MEFFRSFINKYVLQWIIGVSIKCSFNTNLITNSALEDMSYTHINDEHQNLQLIAPKGQLLNPTQFKKTNLYSK